MKSRRIKIAVIAESSAWKGIQSLISSNYYFELPKSIIPDGEEKSANFVPEFIEYKQSLAAYIETGSDPYLRPFLYLYVVSVKNDEIDTDTIEKINRWIENNKMLQATCLVILIQEDKKVFGNSKPINIEQITQNAEDGDDIIIFSVRQRKQTQDQLIEEIKNSIRNHIINDCKKYKNDTTSRLKGCQNQKLRQRLTVWKNLLNFFFGFYTISLRGFGRAYKQLARLCKISLNELLEKEIDPEQIKTHPFTDQQEPIDSLMFALHGEMAVSYAQADFMSLVNFFFQHFGFMRSKCVTPEDNEKVNKWGEKSIDLILQFGEIMSHPKVASNLLHRKLQLVKERNGTPKEISTLYRTLRKLIPGRIYMITSLDTGYLAWKSEKRKEKTQMLQEQKNSEEKDTSKSILTENSANTDLNDNQPNISLTETSSSNSNVSKSTPHLRTSHQDSIYIDYDEADEADAINNFTKEEKNRPSMLGWPSITSVLETIFKERYLKGEFDQLMPYAIRLLADSSHFTRKARIFNDLMNLPNSISIRSPFTLQINIKTNAFEQVINASTPITITAIVKTPKWLPLNFDTALLRLLRPSGPSRMSMVSPQESLGSIPSSILSSSSRQQPSGSGSVRISSLASENSQSLSESQPSFHNRSRSQSLSISCSPSQEFTNQSESLISSKGLTFSVKNDQNEIEIKDDQKSNKKYNQREIIFKDVCIRAPGNWYVAIIGFRFKNLTIYSDLMPKSYMIKVDKGVNAPITVDFPKVFHLNKDSVTTLKAVMKIDYTKIASTRCFHQLSFIDDIDGLIENCKMNEVNLSVVDKRGEKKNKRGTTTMSNGQIEVNKASGTTSYTFERSLSKGNLNSIAAGTSLASQSPLSLTSFESSFEIPTLSQMSPSQSSYASIPAQKGVATFSDGSTGEFQIERDGRLYFLADAFSPVLKVATIPFTFQINPKGANENVNEDESDELSIPNTTALLVDSKIDTHKWQVAFVHALECPIVCRSRIVTKKVIHFELQNKCELPLTIQKVEDKSEKIVIQPGRMYYLIHTRVHEPLKILVSDGFGEPIEKVWSFDKSMVCPELISNIDKKDEYPSGVPINVEFDLQPCSYKYLKSDAFAVVGITKMNKFVGGKVRFQIIPISVGVVETPNMKINGVVHSVLPKFINVTSASTMSLGPFLDKSC